MSEQSLLINKPETNEVKFSLYFNEPKNFRLIKFKQDSGIEVTEDDKYEYNFSIGEQAKNQIIDIHERLAELKTELKNLRLLNKTIKDPNQKQENITRIIPLSFEQDNLLQKEESIVEEMCRLEML